MSESTHRRPPAAVADGGGGAAAGRLNERLPVQEYSVHRRIKGLVLPRRTHSDDERDDYVVISRDMVQSICNFDDDNTITILPVCNHMFH